MRLKLSLLLILSMAFSWSQTTQTFSSSGTFIVPPGVTNISVQAWGGGGSGGGASGAGLLFGRGAAGGGGGAYASADLTVTAGATLNVVVAGQTSGTSGATGSTGGISKITGYESVLLAAGGSGGGANNAGGTPIGGNGGLVANSTGTIKLPGFNGVNGNTWSLLSILLTSGAGGTGANFGGAGGAAVGSLILGTAPGNAGSVPGGGGSGAINSALGTSQSGGTGGAGKVIITYTIPLCPTYAISGTTATNTCISNAQSTVTISSAALSLPVGSYVVTYNRSSPSATGLTANMTVSTAGTGTFTATGFTTAGLSNITITKLTLGSCFSNIVTNNTATITISPTTIGGSVNGGTTICSGNTSGLLTLSGNTGTIVKWQSSVSPFTTWTDIANTNATYTSGVLTATTQFRAVVQSGICGIENSAATTVTVNPSPTIALAASALNVCLFNTGESTPLSYSGTTGSPVTYSIVWNSSPANSFVPVTDATLLSGAIAVLVPAGTAVGIYSGTVTVKNAAGCVSSGSVFTVNVNNIPNITTTGTIASVCASTNSQNAALAYSAAIGSPTRYSINWNPAANAALLADQAVAPFTFVPSGGSINTIVIPENVPAGTYSGTMTIANETCIKFLPVSITILPATVGGTVNGGTAICSGNTSGLLTLSGHTGSVVKWQSSVSPFSSWTDIANTNTTYTSGILTETTQFRAVVQNGICDAVNSAATTVTVNPLPTITASASAQPACVSENAQNTTLSYSATSGSPTTYSIVWDSSSESSFEAVTDAALSGSNITIAVPAETGIGTYTGTLTVKNAAGCISAGSVFTVTVNDVPVIITFGVMYSVCTSTNPQTGSLEYDGFGGNPTSYAIDWDSAANAALLADQPNTPFAFQQSADYVNTILIPANVPGGTYEGILILYNGSCSSSRRIVLGVAPVTVGGTVIGGTTICSGNTSGELTLTDYTGSVVNWQSSVSPFTTWVDIDNTELTYTSGPLIETTQFRAVIQSGECSVVNSEATTVTVSPLSGITVQQPFDLCSYSDSLYFDLPFTITSGSPVIYSVTWDGPAAAIFEPITDFPLDSIVIDNSASPPVGVYTGTITVKNELGCESPGLSFNINVIAPPTITTTGIIDAVCVSTTVAQNANLLYSATTGSPTSYEIDWDSDSLTDQPSTSFAFSSGSGGLNTIQIPANTPAGNYSGTLTFTNGNCPKRLAVSITISPTTVGGTVTGGTTIASGNTSGLLTLSGQTGSVVKWQSSVSPFSTWTDIENINTTYTSGPLTETTQFRVVIQSGVCDTANSEPTTVTVGDLPTITPETTGICLRSSDTSSPAVNAILYYTKTGTPVTYSIVWNSSPPNNLVAVTDAALSSSSIPIAIPAGTNLGTYTGTITVKNANGVTSLGSSFNLIVNRVPSISTTGTINSVTSSNTVLQNTTLSYSATTDSPTSYAIDWDSAANGALLVDQVNTAFAFSSSGGIINNIEIPANVPAGTYSGFMSISNSFCFEYQPVSITINAGAPTITVGLEGGDICLLSGSSTPISMYTALFYTATGSPVTYSIVWDPSPANSLVAVTDAELTSSPIYIEIAPGTALGTYSGTITVKNANGVSSSGSAFSVNIATRPTINIFGTVNSVCSSTIEQNAILEYSGITGNPTSYYIDWDSTANAAFLSDQPSTPYEFEGIGGLIESIQIAANAQPGTYSGILNIVDGSCTGYHDISITINQMPTPPIVEDVTPSSSDTPTGSVTLSGLPSGNWILSVNPGETIINSSGETYTVEGLYAGLYSVSVSNNSTCSAATVPVSIPAEESSRGALTKNISTKGATDLESTENTISVSSLNKVINVETPNQIINEVYIFDVAGALIYEKANISDSKLKIDNLRSSNQVLVVKVVLNNNQSETRKVIF